MTGHPQGSNRGLRLGPALNPTSLIIQNNTGSITLSPNTTGLKLANSTTSVSMGPNSSGAVLSGGLKLKNTTGQITINSTVMALKKNLQVGPKATLLSSNSTGVKLGAKYFTGNTTSN